MPVRYLCSMRAAWVVGGDHPSRTTPAVLGGESPPSTLLSPFQIDELYEAYCVQRRLRDGAYNMVRAYSTGSPGSREARDSLAEATRGHREYTEVRDEDHCGRVTRCGLLRVD